MSQNINVPKMAQTDTGDNHVTVSQCSNRSIPSENETLPVLTPRNFKQDDKLLKKTKPSLRYTNRKENSCISLKHAPSTEKLDYNGLSEHVQLSDKDKHNQEDSDEAINTPRDANAKIVFLPRLNDADQRLNCINKRSIDTDYIRFPEISTISKKNGLLALNRSITDLLDPEMEILNKIKHMPRKKRKRRRKKFDAGTPV